MREVRINNKTFASFLEACRHFQISEAIVRSRLKSGWSMTKAFTTPKVEQRKKIKISGKTFSSLSEASRYFKIDKDTVSARLTNGWSMHDALKTPLTHEPNQYHKIPVTIDGVEYDCIADAARAYGLNPETVYTRINQLEWSIEEAIKTPVFSPGEVSF